ncbi:stage III sporulation protein AF [Paenibacillus sp. LHD-38]|uniref:stage III sporulation protein AF n=1 Tax=Paenibacillus sp. LHD-38 TaxID=3072143 RepID=UPI00280EF510|nr:stage III sporulation protein AF [Paenibacillus sp. LHD-38]MDQ8735560.1 stage III sporulation protein AF [Paenibacillus sp. LHD-38]
MVAWLSDWLRDIIAVILLAVFVELLLPNRAMQRYARLVIGLFILLTILSPILKLIQSDIGGKLDEGMENWSKSAMAGENQMAGLSQINRDAEAMSEKRSIEAAKLTERTLEASILNELVERTDEGIADVDATLKWVNVSGHQTPYISQVTVTLQTKKQNKSLVKEGDPVDEVQPVIVDVDIEPVDADGSFPSSQETEAVNGRSKETEQADGKWSRADPASVSQISSLITKGWGLAEDQIIIRQPAEQRLPK